MEQGYCNEPTPADPQKGQRVEILFDDHQWYPGKIASLKSFSEISITSLIAKGKMCDAASNKSTTSNDLQKLFLAVNRQFPELSSTSIGAAGTMRPAAKIKILSEIAQSEQGETKYDFVDLGCSSGHVLACAAISG